MQDIKQWLEEVFEEIDSTVREIAFSNVINKLKSNGIDPKEIDEEDLKEMVAHEIEKIKKFGTGAALGMGAMIALDMLL